VANRRNNNSCNQQQNKAKNRRIAQSTKVMKFKPNLLVKFSTIALFYESKSKCRFVTEPPFGGLAIMNDLQQSSNRQATQPNAQV